MEYKDKRTLSIMSGLNKTQDNDYYSIKNKRSRDRQEKRSIVNFYLRNISIMDRIWWSFLSEDERYGVYEIWTYRTDRKVVSKQMFFKDMMNRYDKKQQIRDKKIESLL